MQAGVTKSETDMKLATKIMTGAALVMAGGLSPAWAEKFVFEKIASDFEQATWTDCMNV